MWVKVPGQVHAAAAAGHLSPGAHARCRDAGQGRGAVSRQPAGGEAVLRTGDHAGAAVPDERSLRPAGQECGGERVDGAN